MQNLVMLMKVIGKAGHNAAADTGKTKGAIR